MQLELKELVSQNRSILAKEIDGNTAPQVIKDRLLKIINSFLRRLYLKLIIDMNGLLLELKNDLKQNILVLLSNIDNYIEQVPDSVTISYLNSANKEKEINFPYKKFISYYMLAALVDNHVNWGYEPHIDPRRVTWGRVLDVNDRSLRSVVTGLGGRSNGFTKESRFDITAASEVMAILSLATDLRDLQQRLGNIKVGRTANQEMVFAKDIKAEGAMTVLLKEALNPNLVQTLEHNPALVHGGPFGNIAHGCSSVVATKAALTLADYVVTEGGFGADLGAEKFFNIKCRRSGLKPACAVVVGTIKALKLHGGAKEKELEQEDLDALRQGLPNLLRHLENVKKFGVPAVLAINQFTSDTKRELELVEQACADHGVKMALANHWAEGGAGALCLAETVREVIEKEPADFRVLYPDTIPLAEKVRIIAREIYRAEDVEIPPAVHARFAELEKTGLVISRFAWQRRSTVFPPTPPRKEPRPDLRFRFERFALRWAQDSWWSLRGI